jgi:hypothetical protein
MSITKDKTVRFGEHWRGFASGILRLYLNLYISGTGTATVAALIREVTGQAQRCNEATMLYPSIWTVPA